MSAPFVHLHLDTEYPPRVPLIARRRILYFDQAITRGITIASQGAATFTFRLAEESGRISAWIYTPYKFRDDEIVATLHRAVYRKVHSPFAGFYYLYR